MLFHLTTLSEGGILQPRLYVKQSMSRGTHVKQILHVERTFYKIFPEILKFERVRCKVKPNTHPSSYISILSRDIFSRVSFAETFDTTVEYVD